MPPPKNLCGTYRAQRSNRRPPPRPKPAGSAGPSKSDKDGVKFSDPDQRAQWLTDKLNGLTRT
jgi:hypothetical protein